MLLAFYNIVLWFRKQIDIGTKIREIDLRAAFVIDSMENVKMVIRDRAGIIAGKQAHQELLSNKI